MIGTNNFYFIAFVIIEKLSYMEVTGSDISFSLQHGLVRDAVTINTSQLTLKTLKDCACDFINTKIF
ncbi:hypothetical protein Avbf_06374 [Armadillidium vulgare]|nr:hypothetical protein Avbf_06374 [Armadillidium vulgare]